MPNDGEVLAGATAHAVADEFAAAVERFGTASASLVAAAGRLADERVWNGASAARFRAEQQCLASKTRAMTQSLTRMANAARRVLGAIDQDDQAGRRDEERDGENLFELITGMAERAHLPWDLGGGLAWELGLVKPAERAAKDYKNSAAAARSLNLSRKFADASDARQTASFVKDVVPVLESQEKGQATRQEVLDAFFKWSAAAKEDAEDTGALEAALERQRARVSEFKESAERAESLAGRYKVFSHGVMGSLGVLSDASVFVNPPDSGVAGDTDRAAAAINAGAIVAGTDLAEPAVLAGANALGTALGGTALGGSIALDGSFATALASANSLDEIPVVGEVILAADIGTGVYLGVNYLMHHPHMFDDVGSAIGHAASWFGKEELALW